MTRLQSFILPLALTFFASLAFAEMPNPDARELWKYITVKSPYTGWDYWGDHLGLQKGDAPHAAQHKVFVNKTGLASKTVPAHYGTIIVKENIGKDNTLKALTVMYKVKDYNPEAGDWYWAKYNPKGKVDISGKIKGCISCHSSEDENDFIFVHEFE